MWQVLELNIVDFAFLAHDKTLEETDVVALTASSPLLDRSADAAPRHVAFRRQAHAPMIVDSMHRGAHQALQGAQLSL